MPVTGTKFQVKMSTCWALPSSVVTIVSNTAPCAWNVPRE